jgi:hypothetical protein
LEPILYLETNFAVCVAKGQDVVADRLVVERFPGLRVIFPSVCVIESLALLPFERKQRNVLQDELKKHAREASRDKTSAHAPVLAGHLENAATESNELLIDIELRLYDALDCLSEDAELIELNPEIIRDCLSHDYLKDPTDNLILCSVLWHARLHPAGPKAFLSENHGDFGRPAVTAVLAAADVRYFRRADAAVGWLRAQDRSEQNP